MPTITVTETFEGRAATGSEDGQRERNRIFYVNTDDATLGVDEVALALPVQRGDIWVSPYGTHDFGCTCRAVEIRERESPYEWIATVKYTSKPLASSGAQSGGGGSGANSNLPEQTQIENPLERPAEIRFGTAKERVPAIKDRHGDPFVNSAGDPFDPPYEVDQVRETITITWNRASWHAGLVTQYVDHLNSSDWLSIPAGFAKCTELTADRHFENGLYYFRVTMTVELSPLKDIIGDPVAWKVRILDAGFRKVNADPEKDNVPILDRQTFRPVSKPALLDGDGNQLPVDGVPHFLEFEPWFHEEFANLIGG